MTPFPTPAMADCSYFSLSVSCWVWSSGFWFFSLFSQIPHSQIKYDPIRVAVYLQEKSIQLPVFFLQHVSQISIIHELSSVL
jgi:hypothetical protein